MKVMAVHPRDAALDRLWKHVSGCESCNVVGGLDAPLSLLCVRGTALYWIWNRALPARLWDRLPEQDAA